MFVAEVVGVGVIVRGLMSVARARPGAAIKAAAKRLSIFIRVPSP